MSAKNSLGYADRLWWEQLYDRLHFYRWHILNGWRIP